MIRVLFLFLWLLPTASLAETEVLRFELDGIERRYQLTLPDASRAPLPLVVVLHGAFQNDKRMVIATRGRWEELAETQGFAMVMGSAVNRLWSLGDGTGAVMAPERDDMAYVDQIIAQARARAQAAGMPVDARRIYLVGYSMGGQMSFAYGCQRPEVAAVVSVAMPLPTRMKALCAAAPARPVMLIHGTADPVVPFEGGSIYAGPSEPRVGLLGHDESLAIFAARAGCGARQEVARYDAKPDGTAAVLVRYTGCRLPVSGLRIEGHGHRWPGGGPDLPQNVIGPASEEVDGADVIWQFLAGLG